MRKLWLIFAQAVTVMLAALFIVATLKPGWLGRGGPLGGMPAAITEPLSAVTPQLTVHQAAPVQTSADARTASLSFADAAQRAAPAVVNIYTTKQVRQDPRLNDPFFRYFFGDRDTASPRRENSLGSGVIVSPQGLVLTNNHVVESADEIEVALNDGRKTLAKVIGADPESDLAVLKIELPKLQAITLGNLEQVRVGDPVLAIGNPFGVGQTVTSGIVSALGRSHLGINTFENFIQTDAAINPGNSGGALVDAQGNLLGINTAIFSRDGGSLGIGFAIPVSTAKQVMESILSSGQVTRGYIGVDPQDLNADLAQALKAPDSNGVVIRGVVKNGPADAAGVKPGDVLVAINGQTVKDRVEVLNTVAQLVPGKGASLKISRNGDARELQVTVGKRPRPQRQSQGQE
jgi:serine protease DegQ